jgi:hypothetical protein
MSREPETLMRKMPQGKPEPINSGRDELVEQSTRRGASTQGDEQDIQERPRRRSAAESFCRFMSTLCR